MGKSKPTANKDSGKSTKSKKEPPKSVTAAKGGCKSASKKNPSQKSKKSVKSTNKKSAKSASTKKSKDSKTAKPPAVGSGGPKSASHGRGKGSDPPKSAKGAAKQSGGPKSKGHQPMPLTEPGCKKGAPPKSADLKGGPESGGKLTGQGGGPKECSNKKDKSSKKSQKSKKPKKKKGSKKKKTTKDKKTVAKVPDGAKKMGDEERQLLKEKIMAAITDPPKKSNDDKEKGGDDSSPVSSIEMKNDDKEREKAMVPTPKETQGHSKSDEDDEDGEDEEANSDSPTPATSPTPPAPSPEQGKLDEFTKPTINQIPKAKKESLPLSYDPHIERTEFETLFDELNDLHSGVQTLRSSYGSIIKSLVQMHNRRAKKKALKEQQEKERKSKEKDNKDNSTSNRKKASDGESTKSVAKDAPVKLNFMTDLSELTPKQAKQMESCLEAADKYDMERFVNPVTREDTFKQLFDECDQLLAKTEAWHKAYFDEKGNFLAEKYHTEASGSERFDRVRFNHYRMWCKKLSTVVDEICRAYNDDLLNMFRLGDV